MVGRRAAWVAPPPSLAARLDALLAEVGSARLPTMRAIWARELGVEAPTLRSPEIVRRMLGYELQARVQGRLSNLTRRRLLEIEERRLKGEAPPPPPVRLAPGAVLEREWQGVRHEVRVTAEGYTHRGTAYRSLSEVARAITGTRWNGPRFFGLREGR